MCLGVVTFFLVVTKGLKDACPDPSAASYVAFGFGLIFAIYVFFLFRVESASRVDREAYHRLAEVIGTQVTPYGWVRAKMKEGGLLRGEEPRETLTQTVSRSWAALPAASAVLVIWVACWAFLFPECAEVVASRLLPC